MEGEVESSEEEGSFSKASIPKRLAIVVAGATVNIVFGLVVYFILTASSGVYISNEVDSLVEGYAAEQSGIIPNDKIVKINNIETKSRQDISDILDDCQGNEVLLEVERNGKTFTQALIPTEQKLKSTGIYLKDNGKVVTVEKGSSAEKYGIQANDEIVKINGVEINNDVNKILELINQNNTEVITFTIKRGQEIKEIELVPDYIPQYYLGVTFKYAEDTFVNHLIHGGMQTKEFAFSILDSIKKLFTGGVSVDQMMGPVGISETVAKTNGIQEFIYLLALISLSLGVTNLLPIPALDGGKIVLLLIEAIRRKPIKPETEVQIQLLGFSILIALTIYVTYNDILRIF